MTSELSYRISPLARKWTRRTFGVLEVFLYAAVVTIVGFRLGNMQLEGLPTFGAIFLGLFFGFTSLMYNRARAYTPGKLQTRTLFAAELAFQATQFFAMGAALAGVIFYLLGSLKLPPTPIDQYPVYWSAVIGSMIPMTFFVFSFFLISRSFRVLLHHFSIPLRPQHVARRK